MRRKLILGGLTLAVIVAGVIALAAFTAQVVNLTAHVEKDIAVEPVICANPTDPNSPCFVDPSGGDYGVVLPQEFYDKIIEVTLSNSFFEQTKYDDLAFDVLWECKQFSDGRDEVNNLTGEPPGDGWPDCREQGLDDSICAVDTSRPRDGVPDTIRHCDREKLDGNLRDHVQITPLLDGRCYLDQIPQAKMPPEKKVEYVATGFLDKVNHKCRYELKLFAPPCIGGFNPFTDPHPLVAEKQPVWCHVGDKNRDGDPDNVNPQDIDEFADLGDDFKIQVTGHSLAGACDGVNDTCIDADGAATPGRGLAAAEVMVGDALTSWPTGFDPHDHGIDWFDTDATCTWTLGDDLHGEGSAYPGAFRDGLHDDNVSYFDPLILDLNLSLVDGQPVDVDLESGMVDPSGQGTSVCQGVDPLLKFHDADGDGYWDDSEDIVLDGNNDGVFN